MNADPRVMEFFLAPLSRAESDALVDAITAHHDQRGFGLLAAELRETGEFLGFVGFAVPTFTAPFTPCVEIGWRFAPAHWGCGLASEGARAVLRQATGEVVSFTSAG